MPSERYKSDPEYARGYEAAMRREKCPHYEAPPFQTGHAAGSEAIRILEQHGFDETAPGKFTKTFTL